MKELLGQLKFLWKVMLHPIDGFYELQYERKGSVLSASILIAAFFLCEVASLAITNFVFNLNGLKGTSPVQLLVYTIVPIAIWVVSNYLIGAITNGAGSLKMIFITTAYTLLPYIFFSIPLALLSNVLTEAEQSIYSFFNFVIIAWVGIMLYFQVKEVQDYDVFEAVRNILLVIFTAALIVIFSAALYGIFLQAFNFLVEFFREVLGFD